MELALPPTMQEDLYCKVYVDGASNSTSLISTIADVANGQVKRRTVRTPFLEVDVFDQSRHVKADAGDDFVYWPSYLEVFAADGVSFDAFVQAMADLLDGLGERGLRVVASCDFEEQIRVARLKSTR